MTRDPRNGKPGGTILVVDDLETNLELLERILTAQGYDVRPDALVAVGVRVPMAAQAQHADAHRILAANNRRVEPSRGFTQLQTPPSQMNLLLERQVFFEVERSRRSGDLRPGEVDHSLIVVRSVPAELAG